jgi:hypothetical protein
MNPDLLWIGAGLCLGGAWLAFLIGLTCEGKKKGQTK